jgi:hypothetical protein
MLLRSISFSLSPEKRNLPESKLNIKDPRLKISHFYVYPCELNISGAI